MARFSWTGFALVLGAVTVSALFWYALSSLRHAYPIRYVRIEGKIVELDEASLSRAIAPLVRTGFFDVDLDEVEATARSFAWVENVQVVRQWPDTLVIKLSENRPVARWNRQNLLSEKGQRFTPSSVDAFGALPALSGPEAQQQLVFRTLQKFDELLKPQRTHVTELTLTARQSWSAVLSDGMEIMIGRRDPQTALKNLLHWLPELERQHAASVKKVDLRYRNGFSVVWGLDTESDAIAHQRRTPGDGFEPRPSSVPNGLSPIAALQW